MHLGLKTLSAFLDARRGDAHLVLVTVVSTEGSTYRKPGAMMLVDHAGDFAGLVSGGCLEADLAARARAVIDTGVPARVTYDLADEDNGLLGLGLGCGGAVHLLLQRLDAEEDFEPLASLFTSVARGAGCRLALVTGSDDAEFPLGTTALAGSDGVTLGPPALLSWMVTLSPPARGHRARALQRETEQGALELLVVDVERTPRILLCGAGPDALPLARQVVGLGWDCLVVDHRAAFADPERFPPGTTLFQVAPRALGEAVDLDTVDAAVVMTHHLGHDADYLSQLASRPPRYLGLLGPRARRDRLLADIGHPDLPVRGPAGLDVGAELPEAIALAIMAEIHARLAGREGGFLTGD